MPLSKRRILFFLFCFLVQSFLFAQSNADSLKQSLQLASEDSNKVKTLNRLAWILRSTDPDAAMTYAEEARSLAERIGFDKGRGDSYNYIGVIYYRRGEYVEATKAHLQALHIRELIGDKQGMGLSYINLGNVYSDQNNADLALNQYQKAAEVISETADRSRLPVLFLNISAIFITQGKFDLGLDYCRKAREEARLSGDLSTEALAVNNSGVALEGQKKYEAAGAAYEEAYTISESAGDKNGMIDAAINLGNIARIQKTYDKALDWHFKAEKMGRENEYMEGLRVLYEDLSKDYEEMGDYKKALAYHIRFKEVNDSLFNDENTSMISDLTNRWQNEKRRNDLAFMEKEIAKREETEEKIWRRFWFVVIGGLLLLIFAGYLFYAWQRNRRANQLLATQKDLIERKSQELAIKNKDITDSIIYSRRIQQSMLPSLQKLEQHLPDAFIFYRPRDIVSGDFYWVEPWGNEILIAAADCTGHGVPGALLSVVGLNMLNQALQVYGISKPSLILNALNKGMAQALGQQNTNPGMQADPFFFSDGMDIALISINREKRTLSFAGANNPLWIVRNGELIEIPANRISVGHYHPEEPAPFSNHEMSLQKGDCIYIFTDGFADQLGGPGGEHGGKKYMQSRFKELLRSIYDQPPIHQKQILEKEFDHWKGMLHQVDDALVIGIRI